MTDTINTTPRLADLRARRDEILALAKKYGAYNVRVFGSVARDEATAESDIDLLVNLEAWVSLYDLSGLAQDMRALLGHGVDIVEDHPGLKERFWRRIQPELVAL